MANMFKNLIKFFVGVGFFAIIAYMSTFFWQIPVAIAITLILVLLMFIFFEWPYKICLFFFRGNSIGAAMIHPWKKKIIWYYKDGYPHSIQMQRHEKQHLIQIAKEGSWKFVFKYLFYLLKYGYTNNPYEVEARQAEEA